jgi:hypothetical protein
MFERLNWLPQYYMVVDDLVVRDMYEQININILPKVDYAFFPDIHPSNVEFDKYIDNRKNVLWLNTDKPEFRDDLPNCGINKTVVNAGIQVAAYLGFTEIYLIGVDMTFVEQKVKKLDSRNWEAEDNDPNHFDPRYFGKGYKYHNPTVHEMLEKFQWAKDYFDKRGKKVYNAGIGGNLEVFPRVKFESLFTYTELEEEMLFDSSFVLLEKKMTFKEHLSSAVLLDKLQDSYPIVFKVNDKKLLNKLIVNLISDYYVIGPYRQCHYFIKK